MLAASPLRGLRCRHHRQTTAATPARSSKQQQHVAGSFRESGTLSPKVGHAIVCVQANERRLPCGQSLHGSEASPHRDPTRADSAPWQHLRSAASPCSDTGCHPTPQAALMRLHGTRRCCCCWRPRRHCCRPLPRHSAVAAACRRQPRRRSCHSCRWRAGAACGLQRVRGLRGTRRQRQPCRSRTACRGTPPGGLQAGRQGHGMLCGAGAWRGMQGRTPVRQAACAPKPHPLSSHLAPRCAPPWSCRGPRL